MSDWRRRLYDHYVSSEQGGASSSSGYRSEAPFINHLIARHLPADRDIRILDLGCGAGGAIFWLKKAGYRNVAGVDSSPEMVAAAAKGGVHEVKLGDLREELKNTADNSVDLVIVIDVLEHMSRDVLFEACGDIFRVLRPGGHIIAHVPNAEGIFGSRSLYGDLTHELAFTSTSVRQLFLTIGFREIECYEDKPRPHNLKSGLRALVWQIGSTLFRALHAAETGSFDCILSQNLLAIAKAPRAFSSEAGTGSREENTTKQRDISSHSGSIRTGTT
ncbi:class I SAM-dependent DNA methyltransferase [Methylosinus sporium]|nr:class I SAM-dependent methyltransferase [Methylosinus sporium]